MAQPNNPTPARPNSAAMTGSGVSGTPTMEELLARLAQVEAQNKALVDAQTSTQELYFKIASKGGISLYGLSKQWPVTLYIGQWERLLAMADRIKRTLELLKKTHAAHIAVKGVDLPAHVDADGKGIARTGAIKLVA